MMKLRMRWRSSLGCAICVCILMAVLSVPVGADAAELKAYNYATDYSPFPWYSTNLSAAGDISGQYQDQILGIDARWPVCTREFASSPFNNMKTTTTAITNIWAHGGTDSGRSAVCLFPPSNADGATGSYLYSKSQKLTQPESFLQGSNWIYVPVTAMSRIQDMGTVPSSQKLAVFQGCQTGMTSISGVVPVAKQIVTQGVDTGVGFTGLIYFSLQNADGSLQYWWSKGYWSSLANHNYNSKAMDDGMNLVWSTYGKVKYYGYDTHARWGTDCRF